MITAKELLDTELDIEGGKTTLRYIFQIFNGEGQFGSKKDTDGYEYELGSFDGFYEPVAQKIIDTVVESQGATIYGVNIKDARTGEWRFEPWPENNVGLSGATNVSYAGNGSSPTPIPKDSSGLDMSDLFMRINKLGKYKEER